MCCLWRITGSSFNGDRKCTRVMIAPDCSASRGECFIPSQTCGTFRNIAATRRTGCSLWRRITESINVFAARVLPAAHHRAKLSIAFVISCKLAACRASPTSCAFCGTSLVQSITPLMFCVPGCCLWRITGSSLYGDLQRARVLIATHHWEHVPYPDMRNLEQYCCDSRDRVQPVAAHHRVK